MNKVNIDGLPIRSGPLYMHIKPPFYFQGTNKQPHTYPTSPEELYLITT